MERVNQPSEPHPITVLNAIGIRKKYGSRSVLKSVSLQISSGECVVMEGANGAGKSTLLRILAGALKPDSFDEITLYPVLDYGTRSYRAAVGYLGHQPLFYGELTALENLSFYASLYHLDRNKDEIMAALARFELDHRAADQIRTFSRGMKQRLGLCILHLLDPLLYLLDEPYTGLDQKNQKMLNEMIADAKSAQKAILITTHNREEVDPIATDFIQLEKGSIQGGKRA